jgi:predicted transposase/invertase (TIGR01784 family)
VAEEAKTLRVDHDGLFKDLLHEFFVEFMQIFFPHINKYLDLSHVRFLQQEIISGLSQRNKGFVDLLVEVKLKGNTKKGTVLIHMEHQATKQKDFSRRMYRYFQKLDFKHRRPVIPVAIFAYKHIPREEEPQEYIISYPFGEVLRFRFFKLELKKLNWREYLKSENPAALALMSKMGYTKEEKVQVKLEFLRMITSLKLDPQKMDLLIHFFDTYLILNQQEKKRLNQQLAMLEPEEVSKVRKYTNSWKEEGRKEGRREGRREGHREGRTEGQAELLAYLLKERFGSAPSKVVKQFSKLPSHKIQSLSG